MSSNVWSIDIPVGRGPELDTICQALDLTSAGKPRSMRPKKGSFAQRRLAHPLHRAGRMDFPTLLQRVRSEFNEMPGLRLTPAQAGRLLGLDAPSCQRVLSALVQSAFLRWTHDGTVVRAES
jgi:hypothetical protein